MCKFLHFLYKKYLILIWSYFIFMKWSKTWPKMAKFEKERGTPASKETSTQGYSHAYFCRKEGAQWDIQEIGYFGIFSCLTYQSIRNFIYQNVCECWVSEITPFPVAELLFLLPKIFAIFFKNTDDVFKWKTIYFISLLNSL